jgi:predicted DNA-binding protein
MTNEKQKKECKDKTVIFRMTDDENELLKYLSYRLDRSRSEIMRQALELYFFAMRDQFD